MKKQQCAPDRRVRSVIQGSGMFTQNRSNTYAGCVLFSLIFAAGLSIPSAQTTLLTDPCTSSLFSSSSASQTAASRLIPHRPAAVERTPTAGTTQPCVDRVGNQFSPTTQAGDRNRSAFFAVAGFGLYDLVLRGDKSHDVRPQFGDTTFIPQMGLAGSVRHPAIYARKEEADGSAPTALNYVLTFAGGVSPTAVTGNSWLKRIDDGWPTQYPHPFAVRSHAWHAAT